MMAITDVNDGEVLTGTIYQTIIDTVGNTSTGHDHDGSDSKQVLVTNLDESGLSALDVLRVNTAGTAIEGLTDPFNTSSGHDHDSSDSKQVLVTNLDETGLSALELLRVNTAGTAIEGLTDPFNTTNGHDHDESNSKLSLGTVNIDQTDTSGPFVLTQQSPMTTKKTWTFTPPDGNCILLGFIYTGNMTQGEASGNETRMKITCKSVGAPPVTTEVFTPVIRITPNIASTQSFVVTNVRIGDVDSFPLFPISTTIVFEAQFDNGSGSFDGSCDDLQLTVFWLKSNTITTNSGLIT